MHPKGGPGALIMKCVAVASGQPDSFLSLQAISGPMPKSVHTHRLSRSCRSRPQHGRSKVRVADNTCEGRQHAGSGERGVSAFVYKGVFAGHASGWRQKPLVRFCLAEPWGRGFSLSFCSIGRGNTCCRASVLSDGSWLPGFLPCTRNPYALSPALAKRLP